jgi:anti-anti-sigma regulatory factor
VHGGMDTWRGRGVVVLTPAGRLGPAHVAGCRDAVDRRSPAVLVVDLVQTDTADTDAVAALLRTLADARRRGWRVVVANPTPDVEIALRPLSIPVVDTTEGSPVDLPGQRLQEWLDG